MDEKHAIGTNLLWLDLEMTGLDATKDRILEVAAIATRLDFATLATYEAGVDQNESEIRALLQANEFAKGRPAETEQLVQVALTGKSEQQVEQDLLDLISANFGDAVVYVAGNSIHADRGFIKQWWPRLHTRLHYRMLDVTSWKIIFEGKYGESFTKAETHRALTDIEESIAELQYYLTKVQ